MIYRKQQQGAVLFVALMLLIILTMVGISALESTKLETRMAANLREYHHALQAAEIGLATARSVANNKQNLDGIIGSYGEVGKPLSDEVTDVKRDTQSGNYKIHYTLVAAEPPPTGSAEITVKETKEEMSGSAVSSIDVLKLAVTSTGWSTAKDNAAEVVLKGGIKVLIPR